MVDILTAVFIALGCVLGVIGGIGMHRFNDFYARLHAVGVTDTSCSFLVLCGLALQSGLSLVSVKLFLIFLFLLFTSPASSFSLANSAWQWGLRPEGATKDPVDTLEDKQK